MMSGEVPTNIIGLITGLNCVVLTFTTFPYFPTASATEQNFPELKGNRFASLQNRC